MKTYPVRPETENWRYDFFKSTIPLLEILIVLTDPGALAAALFRDQDTGSDKMILSIALF